jgi:PAS domain S-box-containing protein
MPSDPLDPAAAARALLPDASAEFLGRALELAGVAVWRLEFASGRFLMNPAGWAVVGLPLQPDGAPAEVVREAVHPDDLPAIVAAAEQARLTDRTIDVLARYRQPDGSGWRTMLTRRVAERDGEGRVVSQLGVGLDMSVLMAERARGDHLAERTRLVAQAMGVGFWSFDPATGELHWDEQMHRLHGRDPALGPPSLASWVNELVHEDDRAYVAERARRSNLEWEPLQEIVVRLVDGSDGPRWVRAWTARIVRPDGSRLQLGMTMDVTEQQRSRARLERERERLAFAVQAAGVGIWERDAEGRIVYWNDVMYRQRGLDPADPAPPHELALRVSDAQDLAELFRRGRQAVLDGQPYRGELRVHRPDGSVRWLLSEGRPIYDERRRHLGTVGVHLDITEHKQAQALVQQAQRLEQASRDKSAFMARMSHELRTPLNAILGFARLLESDDHEPPSVRQAERLRHIRASAGQLLTMIDEVLELARTEAGNAPVAVVEQPLDPLLQALAARLAPRAMERGLSVRWPAAGTAALRVRIDFAMAERALGVLLGQVLRCAPRHSEVVVTATVAQGSEAGFVVLAVDAPDLRQPDAQADLDAALARRWIATLGGDVTECALPSVDGGARLSRWQVRLPAAGPAGPAASSMPASTLDVLYVEDNPVNLLLVRELLALRPQCRLIAAEDGAQGIAAALAELPDLLLLDMQLPDTDGIRLMQRLRAEPRLADATYIALSADAMPERIAAARAAGFDDYWTKPLDFEQFLAGIDRLLAAQATRLGSTGGAS